jgi:hypothetical protein
LNILGSTCSSRSQFLEEVGDGRLILEKDVCRRDDLSGTLIEVLRHSGVTFVDIDAKDLVGNKVRDLLRCHNEDLGKTGVPCVFEIDGGDEGEISMTETEPQSMIYETSGGGTAQTRAGNPPSGRIQMDLDRDGRETQRSRSVESVHWAGNFPVQREC